MLAWRDAILAYALFYPAVEFLSFATIALIYCPAEPHSFKASSQPRSPRGIHYVCAAFFPANPGSQREIQHPPIRDGGSERIFKLLDEPVLVESDPNAIPLDHPLGEIEFRNVCSAIATLLSPPTKIGVLRDVSLRVEPGQTFAIVGHTGAGKTT